MSIALSEFWSRLVQTGLADSESCKRHAAAFADANGGAPADSVESLVAFLHKSGDLTSFQAAALITPESPAIRFGSFVMTSDQPTRPLSHWMPVQTVLSPQTSSGATMNPRSGFLLRVPLSGLDDARRSWLAVHSAIQADALQPIELSGGAKAGDADQVVEIFSPLPAGACLWSVLQKKPQLSRRKTVRVGFDLAHALGTIHESSNGLAHGAVGADHVWVTPKGNAVLLRDPSSPARSPHDDTSASWIERIEPTARNAAPELADPSKTPDAKSDIYSLGCLLFQLLTGRPAFDGDDNRALFAAHRSEVPRELKQAVAEGPSGDPIMRVLAFAMAKDPAARFESAAAMGDALSRAGEMATQPKTVVPQTTKPTEPPAATTQRVAEPPVTAPPKSAAPPKASAPQQPAAPPASAPPKSKPTQVTPPAEPPVVSAAKTKPTIEKKPVKMASKPPVSPTVTDDLPAQEPSSASGVAETAEDASTAEPSSPSRKRRKRNKNRIPILAGIMILPLLMLGLAIALKGRGPQKPRTRPRPQASAMNSVPKVNQSRREVVSPDEPATVNGYELVDSDRLLWVPPYPADSPAPSLELLPPGPAGIISVPIARLQGIANAQPILQTFGPETDALVQMAAKRSGVTKSQIERCTVALFPGKLGWPEVALAIELVEPVAISALSEKWDAFESRTPEGATIYAGDNPGADAYFIGDCEKGKLPTGQDVKRFSVGPLKRIQEVADNEGGTIPLVRSLQSLWNQTSVESELVILMTPNFLFADGREMINASVPEFLEPLNRWLIPDRDCIFVVRRRKRSWTVL